MANKIFNLDLTKDTKINSIVLGRVGDGGLQTITVNISNRDVPVDLTGFTITFEGVTNSSQSKIFDSYGVKTETEKLKQGQFDYTFPSAAFSVTGRYETAYFSFQKDENRDTTGKIDIFVSENADIDAGEAESIITEYNKLVQELHEITDKYISDSDAKFLDLNVKIEDLQTKITQYQNTVKDTADGAIQAVEDALKQFEAGDFYTKGESDANFAPKSLVSEVTDLKGVVNTKANDSEVVHLVGDETIDGKKTFTGSLKVSDNPVFGVNKNEGWYEEQLDTNYYRWTKREDYTNIAVENTHGGGYISPNIPGPTYPSNAVVEKRFPTNADGSVVVATLDGSGMRLMSVASKAARNYSVFWTAYGSKK